MPLGAGTVEEYLNHEGWPLERLDESTWRSSFEGPGGTQRFFVRLTDSWVFFTIAPYVTSPKAPSKRLRLYQRLLELNRELNLAKLALDPDGDVVLTVELPTEHLDEPEFHDALAALSYYGDRYRRELADLAG